MKKIYRGLLLFVLFFLIGFGNKEFVRAAEMDENVNVTIPSSIDIIFHEDGTNSVSEFAITNKTLASVEITSVFVTECNEWQLVSDETIILADTKQISLKVEDYNLSSGENMVHISVPENETKSLDFEIKRGAWTGNGEAEKAFHLEFVYSFGVKSEAYAIYSASDKSLTFVRSKTPLIAGDTYNGKVITSVYTGFEDAVYSSYSSVPWIYAGGNLGGNITSVIVQDTIQPVSTSYWFFCLRDCEYFDMSGLDGTRLTDMSVMFSSAGIEVTGTVSIKGIAELDTSNVTNMYCTFRGAGESANTFHIDDISGWDTSKVTNMEYMFYHMGQYANWSLNLSQWDVRNVTVHRGFHDRVENKIITPKW